MIGCRGTLGWLWLLLVHGSVEVRVSSYVAVIALHLLQEVICGNVFLLSCQSIIRAALVLLAEDVIMIFLQTSQRWLHNLFLLSKCVRFSTWVVAFQIGEI